MDVAKAGPCSPPALLPVCFAAPLRALNSADERDALQVYVLLDGEPVPSHLRGKDVEGDAFGRTFVRVVEPRVYFLIADARVAARGLQLLPAVPGVALNQLSFSSDCDNALPPLV